MTASLTRGLVCYTEALLLSDKLSTVIVAANTGPRVKTL